MQSLLDVDLDDGPEPRTERDYLQALYRYVRELRAVMVALNVTVERQNGRVWALELWQARLMGTLVVVSTLSLLTAGSLLAPLVVRWLGK